MTRMFAYHAHLSLLTVNDQLAMDGYKSEDKIAPTVARMRFNVPRKIAVT